MRGVAARSISRTPTGGSVEEEARRAFDELYGRELGDDEFAEIRLNVLRFFSILKRWDASAEPRVARIQSTDELLSKRN